MAYLHAVARALMGVVVGAGQVPRFQIGEPWRWVMPASRRICLYDDAAREAFGGEPLANGDTRLEWVRRSRAGWGWPDGVDAPIGEEREAYRVTSAVGEPAWIYAAAARAADAAAGRATVTITVAQLGGGGASLSATLVLPTA